MSTDAVTNIVSVLRPLRTEPPDRAALAEALAPFRNTLPSAGALAEAIETEEGSPRSWTNLLIESWAALNGWETPEEEAAAVVGLLPKSVLVGSALCFGLWADVPAARFPLPGGEALLLHLAAQLVSSGLADVVGDPSMVPTGAFRELCHARGAPTDGAPAAVRCRLAALLVGTEMVAKPAVQTSLFSSGPAPTPVPAPGKTSAALMAPAPAPAFARVFAEAGTAPTSTESTPAPDRPTPTEQRTQPSRQESSRHWWRPKWPLEKDVRFVEKTIKIVRNAVMTGDHFVIDGVITHLQTVDRPTLWRATAKLLQDGIRGSFSHDPVEPGGWRCPPKYEAETYEERRRSDPWTDTNLTYRASWNTLLLWAKVECGLLADATEIDLPLVNSLKPLEKIPSLERVSLVCAEGVYADYRGQDAGRYYPANPWEDPIPEMELMSLATLTNLRSLHLEGYYGDGRDLLSLGALERLESLTLEGYRYCEDFGRHTHIDLTPLAGKESLAELTVRRYESIEMAVIGSFKNLKRLDLTGCLGVVSLKPLANLECLRHVVLSGTSVKDLKPLSELRELERVELQYCEQLGTLRPLLNLPKLTFLKVGAGDLDFSNESAWSDPDLGTGTSVLFQHELTGLDAVHRALNFIYG